MSRAFVKEGDADQLKDVAANMASLLFFLKRENGSPVYELHTRYSEKHRKEVHEMNSPGKNKEQTDDAAAGIPRDTDAAKHEPKKQDDNQELQGAP